MVSRYLCITFVGVFIIRTMFCKSLFVMYTSKGIMINTLILLCTLFLIAVPTSVEDLVVNQDQKTITWTAPAEPNGIIVRYTVQYWELGRRDTAEEVNTTAEERMFLYSNLRKL